MSIKARLGKLEQSNATSKGVSLCFVRIPGDSEADGYLSASINDVGHIERKSGETVEEFKRRAHATEAAGRVLDELTVAEQQTAFKTGDARRLAEREPITTTIGGE